MRPKYYEVEKEEIVASKKAKNVRVHVTKDENGFYTMTIRRLGENLYPKFDYIQTDGFARKMFTVKLNKRNLCVVETEIRFSKESYKAVWEMMGGSAIELNVGGAMYYKDVNTLDYLEKE